MIILRGIDMGIFKDLFFKDNNKSEQSFGFFSFLEEQEKKEKRKQLEEEMENYGLLEWQKDLVRNGNYDLTSFEEEDIEEDDYYSEDD